jgi:hypothetical protein
MYFSFYNGNAQMATFDLSITSIRIAGRFYATWQVRSGK